MASIHTTLQNEDEEKYLFHVRVEEGDTETEHDVTLKKADYRRLANEGTEPDVLIRHSFEFLLDHEPKESILSQFDLTLISKYFPAYEAEMRKRV